jgi:putative acetyltransferase
VADGILVVRRERPGDRTAAREVQWHAFATPELGDEPPAEVMLLDALRACDAWIPELSLVAVLDGEVVGHVVTTRAHVGGRPALGLGPIGVEPEHQAGGIGSALVHASVAAAEAMGEPLVALLGSTEYYGRFGFVPAHEVGVDAPDPAWGDHFQVRTLASYSNDLRGSFEYAPPFNDV